MRQSLSPFTYRLLFLGFLRFSGLAREIISGAILTSSLTIEKTPTMIATMIGPMIAAINSLDIAKAPTSLRLRRLAKLAPRPCGGLKAEKTRIDDLCKNLAFLAVFGFESHFPNLRFWSFNDNATERGL